MNKLVTLFGILVAAFQLCAAEFEGTVTKVVDGDTIWVMKPGHEVERGAVDFAGSRREYFAGAELPVGRRKAVPICDDCPDTGYWLSTNSNKRHNRKCENYRKTRGYPCKKGDGIPCKKCGG